MSRGMQVAAQIQFFQIGITAIKVFVARKHVILSNSTRILT